MGLNELDAPFAIAKHPTLISAQSLLLTRQSQWLPSSTKRGHSNLPTHGLTPQRGDENHWRE
jgi:hypothetical protein